ncbi:hypothetical protein PR048_026893 [Dryococelus australis]|uniref:RING-type domain-containing protein n=1 Tax=Dryococelus australis TaxID=614101 RepID=A0ABQ9GMK8_9NEOP|nr:hypothetical protein PR048_026893 [Dryococelus australis]
MDGDHYTNGHFNQSNDGSNVNMFEVYNDGGGAGEDYEGSDGSLHECSGDMASDENDGPLDQISDTLEYAVGEQLHEEGEHVEDTVSEPSCGSEVDVYDDAQNGNYDGEDESEYLHSDCEDMVDEDLWEGYLIGTPWLADDTWDDAVSMGEWNDYDYYDGDEAWDEDAGDGRFELLYEDYGGDAIPGEDVMDEARDAPVRDNFVTHTATVEAGGGVQDAAPAGETLNREGVNHLCPICLEQLEAQEVGSPWNCRHYFCISCILEWVRRSNTCPVDRDTICKIAVRCRMGSPVTRVVSVMPVALMADEA